MAKVYSIETSECALDNVSVVEKNKFVKSICSEDFTLGQGVAVTNKDGRTLVVTKEREFFIDFEESNEAE